MLNLLTRVLTTKNRDMFMVRLGTKLLLAKFGIVGWAGNFVGFFIRGLIGVLIEDGVFVIDIGLDALREGRKLEEFKVEAKKLYDEAISGKHSEERKAEIRKQYLAIISKIGVVGDGPK